MRFRQGKTLVLIRSIGLARFVATVPSHAMQAIVLTTYGAPDDLELQEVETPVPEDGQVLIRVRASAINDWEWVLVRGRPLPLRLATGLTRPKVRIMGCDIAGQVEAVGHGVTGLEVGDEVYGDLSESGFGGFAQYACVPADAVRPKPKNMTYEQAAAIPHAGMLAQQALCDVGRVAQARTLLVNGAGGGVGPIGLQLAKPHGVTVTGVDNTGKQDFLRALGFDHVIDYTREDFTQTGSRYDLILDVKTTRSPFAYAQALEPQGTYVTVGGTPGRLLQTLVVGRWMTRTTDRNIRILSLQPNQGLEKMTALVEAGDIVPAVDAVYPLRDVPEALRRFGAAGQQGKIVISIP